MADDHLILISDRETSSHTLACLHCGSTYTIVLPMRINAYCRALDRFCRSHRDCQAVPWIEWRSETEAHCQRCQITQRSIAGATIDRVAFVRSHMWCQEGGS